MRVSDMASVKKATAARATKNIINQFGIIVQFFCDI